MWKCPKCGSQELSIQVTTTARLTQYADGEWDTEVAGDTEWDNESRTTCGTCGHCEKMQEFEVFDEPVPPFDLHTNGIYAVVTPDKALCYGTATNTGYSSRAEFCRQYNKLWSKAAAEGFRIVKLEIAAEVGDTRS